MGKRNVAVLVLMALLSAFTSGAYAAAPKPGSKCPGVGRAVVYGGLKYTCVKSKGKVVWSKGLRVSGGSTNGANGGSTNNGGSQSGGNSGGSSYTQPSWLIQNWDVATAESLAPACANSPLSTLVADLDQVESITPLGFVQHDSHNAPVPHLYFNTGSANGATDSSGRAFNSKKIDVVAPADISVRGIIQTMSTPYKEYSIGAHVCGQLWIAFNHLDDLSPELQKAFDESVGKTNAQFSIAFKAGQVLAKASGRAHGFDFRAMDASKPNSGRLAPNIWAPGWVAAVCGLDWYQGALRDRLYAKLASKYTSNQCGQPFQDVAGTASGTWLQEEFITNGNAGENGSFTLVRSHDTPGSFYLSIGANATVAGIKSGTYIYQGSTSTTKNPDPTRIVPGTVACFDGLQTRRYERASAVYVRVTAAAKGSREKIEVAAGGDSCGAEPFVMPAAVTTWWRTNS